MKGHVPMKAYLVLLTYVWISSPVLADPTPFPRFKRADTVPSDGKCAGSGKESIVPRMCEKFQWIPPTIPTKMGDLEGMYHGISHFHPFSGPRASRAFEAVSFILWAINWNVNTAYYSLTIPGMHPKIGMVGIQGVMRTTLGQVFSMGCAACNVAGPYWGHVAMSPSCQSLTIGPAHSACIPSWLRLPCNDLHTVCCVVL